MNSLPKAMKQRIIKLREEGNTQSEIAKRLMIDITTVNRTLKKYKNNQSLEVEKSKGRQPKIKEEELYIIKEIIEEKNDRTLEELRRIFKGITGKEVGNTAITNALKRLKISRKKTNFDKRKYTEINQKKLEIYKEEIIGVKNKNIIFIDETGSSLDMQRQYAYSEKNQRAFGETKLGKSKRVNTIAGLTIKGIVARYSFVGTLTGKLFFKYIKDYLLPVLTSESVVVLDNAKAHYNKEALKLIKSTGAKIIFLPPYSPELNPIEKFWAKFKNYLRTFSAQTIDELFVHINNFFDTFKFESGLNYFLSCGY